MLYAPAKGGVRARPPPKPTICSPLREAERSLHILLCLSPPTPVTRLHWDFPHAHLPQGAGSEGTQKPRRETEGAGRAGRRSHAAPRARRHHVVPAAEECREGGTRTHTRAHAHSGPRRPPARQHPPSTGAPRRAPNAEAERPRAARGPAARRMAPNCHPPARPRHSLARRRTPLASPHAPLLALHFPLTGSPHTRHPEAWSKGGRSPGADRESTQFRDMLGFLSSRFSLQ